MSSAAVTTPDAALQRWADDFAAAVEFLTNAPARLEQLRTPPSGGGPEARLTVLRGVLDRVGVAAPTRDAVQDRAAFVEGVLRNNLFAVRQAVAQALDGILAEAAALHADGHEDPTRPPVLLAADFPEAFTASAGLGKSQVVLASPAGLPPEHPAAKLAAELGDADLSWANNRRCLVLGDRRRLWFEVAAVRELTAQWARDARAGVEEARRREREAEERRRKQWADSPEGRLQTLAAAVEELRSRQPAAQAQGV